MGKLGNSVVKKLHESISASTGRVYYMHNYIIISMYMHFTCTVVCTLCILCCQCNVYIHVHMCVCVCACVWGWVCIIIVFIVLACSSGISRVILRPDAC